MIVLTILTLLQMLILSNAQHFISPCPRLFAYEPRNAESDRWYGQITLISDTELTGVWLRVIFDKPSVQLGNWFGEVVTKDNKDYLIKNRNYKLEPNTPLTIRFYIKYHQGEAPPQLTSFRLNARTMCPEGERTTPAPTTFAQLLTSEISTTTPLPPRPQAPSQGNNHPVFGSIFSQNIDEEDDYFHGDISFITRPKPALQLQFTRASCGTIVKQPRPLITYGQETQEGEFPWHAALYHSRGSDLNYICGASLVSAQYLITVAHCVTRRKTQQALSPDNLLVYLGKYYLKRWANPGIQDVRIEKIFPHPDYSSRTYTNDIAVLKLMETAKMTPFVRPICLWEGADALDPIVGKLGTVAGWGFDQHGIITEKLTKASMPVVSQETCIYSFPDFYSRFTSSSTFCAGFNNGTSVCNGDSGGGLVFPRSGTDKNNQVWQLRGLVSISVALQNQFKCDASHYVVFTDIAKFLPWIKSVSNI